MASVSTSGAHMVDTTFEKEIDVKRRYQSFKNQGNTVFAKEDGFVVKKVSKGQKENKSTGNRQTQKRLRIPSSSSTASSCTVSGSGSGFSSDNEGSSNCYSYNDGVSQPSDARFESDAGNGIDIVPTVILPTQDVLQLLQRSFVSSFSNSASAFTTMNLLQNSVELPLGENVFEWFTSTLVDCFNDTSVLADNFLSTLSSGLYIQSHRSRSTAMEISALVSDADRRLSRFPTTEELLYLSSANQGNFNSGYFFMQVQDSTAQLFRLLATLYSNKTILKDESLLKWLDISCFRFISFVLRFEIIRAEDVFYFIQQYANFSGNC